MPSWIARAACNSPAVSAVVIRSWTKVSRSRSRSTRASANSPIATPATAPPPTSRGRAGSNKSVVFEKASQLARGTATKAAAREYPVSPAEKRICKGHERERRRHPHSARPNPGGSIEPAAAQMASTACACTRGPNSSAAIGVAAISDVPSAETPISTVLPAKAFPVRDALRRPARRRPRRSCPPGRFRNAAAFDRGDRSERSGCQGGLWSRRPRSDSASNALRAISSANPGLGFPPARMTRGTRRTTPSLSGLPLTSPVAKCDVVQFRNGGKFHRPADRLPAGALPVIGASAIGGWFFRRLVDPGMGREPPVPCRSPAEQLVHRLQCIDLARRRRG